MLFNPDFERSFMADYFEGIKKNFTSSSLQLEGEAKRHEENNLKALNYIYFKQKGKMFDPLEFPHMLLDIVNIISDSTIDNFRKINIMVMGSNVQRSKPQAIRTDLYNLINDYNYRISYCKTIDEIYEIEADFHIRLLHIHPFEDCNGRTARIFLFYNLCVNNLVPVIITKEQKKMYCDFIENGDRKGLASLFKTLSELEMKKLLDLYREYDSKGLIESNKVLSKKKC